jgi:glycolate oxidase
MTTSYPDLAIDLETICGLSNVFTDGDDLSGYGMDQTMDLFFPFGFLVKPASPEEIAGVLKVCSKHGIPVTPRGGGSGVTGGALPVRGGVVMSLERLNKIICINDTDRYVIAEAGVVTEDLCTAVEQAGLFFPVAPTSASFSFVGGNVASNAGSMNTCKYGKTADYVLNLEVVLATGEIMWTGVNVKKTSLGPDLNRLFVGAEGTLGIITKVVYRLLPLPKHRATFLAGFQDPENAYATVTAINKSNFRPSTVELVTRNALQLTAAYLKKPLPLVRDGIQAHLLVEFEEENETQLALDMEMFDTILRGLTDMDILVGLTSQERTALFDLRVNIGNALVAGNFKYRDIDVCVPVSFLSRFINGAEDICRINDVSVVIFGHALDGNLHTMLYYDASLESGESKSIKKATSDIYALAMACGGALSGEHGIGMLQKEYLPLQFSGTYLSVLKKLKSVMDPAGILNPGKIV